MRLVLLAPGFNFLTRSGGRVASALHGGCYTDLFLRGARELAYALGSCKIQSRLALSTCKMQLSGGPDKIGLIS